MSEFSIGDRVINSRLRGHIVGVVVEINEAGRYRVSIVEHHNKSRIGESRIWHGKYMMPHKTMPGGSKLQHKIDKTVILE